MRPDDQRGAHAVLRAEPAQQRGCAARFGLAQRFLDTRGQSGVSFWLAIPGRLSLLRSYLRLQ